MRRFAISVLLLALMTPALFGQAVTSLTGVVSDSTGGVIPGATLTIINNQTGAQRETVSNEVGIYTFAQVTPGTWTLTAKMGGFHTVEIKDLQLLVNTPRTINIKFEVGGVAEEVSVTAAAETINTTDVTLGNALTGSAIQQLPSNLRNITTLLFLQPGVTDGGQVNGGKSDQANVTLDGVDINDQVARSITNPVLRVTLDSVQEFRTTTANANADQGRGSGAEVALVTKSGTNVFHGSAYENNRNTKFAANNFFNNRSAIPIAPLNINVFGASFGGPIMKNKLFFFGNYEGRRDASATSVTRTVYNDTFRSGIVTYHNAAGALTQIGPDDIKTYVDPLGIGANPNVMKLVNAYPHCNVAGSGDLLNTCSYQFNFPVHSKQDTYITRLDYTLDAEGKHQLFVRGNLQNDHTPGTPQFPGMEPNSVTLSNNKGIAAGYTWLVRGNMVNRFTYGLTRQGGETSGPQHSPYTAFRNIATYYGTGTNTVRFVPVHTLNEDLSWNKGTHDVRMGGMVRFISNKSLRNNTYHSATTNASGLAGGGNELYNRVPGGLLAGDVTSYTYAMTDLLGLVDQINAVYKYVAKPDGSATVVPQGGNVALNFVGHEYEFYVQDSWRFKPSLTLIGGLRYSLMPPVHEANGQQVSPNINLGDWLGKRGELAAQGLSQAGAGDISFLLSSMPGGLPLYPYNKNFAPRVGVAYSPNSQGGIAKYLFGGAGKTSIRAGFGMYYDLIGQPLAATFANTMFGLSTSLGNPLNILDATTSPRFTDFFSIPTAYLPPAPPAGFPVTYPQNAFAITNSVDNKLKAPYSMTMNLSWSRDVGHGWFVQAAYVGRLSRHSLINRDLAMPTNLKDPSSGTTYFQAMQQMANYVDLQVPASSRNNAFQTIAPIPFFENMWPGAAGGGFTATQNIANYYIRDTAKGDFTTTLQGMDFTCVKTGTTFKSNGSVNKLNCSKLGQDAMFSNQFGALSGWSSIASGNYHAAEVTLRKRFGDGLTMDFNYTLSKSIDLGSGNESSGSFGGGFITNSWDPGAERAVSDYDTLHAVNAYGAYALPIGRGRWLGSSINRALDAIIGGWQVAGIFKATSAGLATTSTGSVWPTNWQISNPAVPTGLPFPEFSVNKNGTLPNGSTNVTAFATQADGQTAIAAYRQSFPGEYGLRNNIRTWGGYNIDSVLSKSFKMPYKESHTVTIRWESFNLPNHPIMGNPSMSMTSTSTWGRITSQRNSPRQMQFGIHYDF